jgi:xylan 1,4-beta-xylosidase
VYNFTQIDSTWDFLHGNQIKPVVELSFMPAVLANCSWHGHCVQNPVGCQGYSCWRGDCKTVGGTPGFPPIVNPSAPACRAKEFHYQGIKQMPAVLNEWYELVRATVAHAVSRYGLAEVQTWSFEVWNELWGVEFPGTAEKPGYMQLYNASARAVKDVDKSLKVGGPATAGLADLPAFVAACATLGLPKPDFVSSHHYPSDGKSGPTPMQQA